METVSALVAVCEGDPPVTGGFPSQRAISAGFDIFFGVSLNKLLNKQTMLLMLGHVDVIVSIVMCGM